MMNLLKTRMYGKLTGLVVLLAVMLVTGIGIGRYCFPQRVFRSTVVSPSLDGRGVAVLPAGDAGLADGGDADVAGDANGSGGGSGAGVPARGSAAERLAEFVAGNPDINEQSDFSKKLITELCAQGRDDEAYGLIDKNPGLVRDVGMFTFYSHRQLR